MSVRCWIAVAGALCVARAAEAQLLRFGVQGVGVSHAEVSQLTAALGGGGGAFAALHLGRFLIELDGYRAALEPEEEGGPAYDILEGTTRISYAFTPAVAVEVGGTRRQIDPEFAAQDVGFFRFGVRSESEIARLARLWVRGAYLAGAKFNGGGRAPFAFEIGMGTQLTTSNRRFGVRAEFDFQRMDREIFDTLLSRYLARPMQTVIVKLGVQIGVGR